MKLADAGELSAALASRWMPAVVAAACGYGLVVAALGVWIGTSDFRRLLRPR